MPPASERFARVRYDSTHLHCAFRISHVQAPRKKRAEALGDARLMDVLRGGESAAIVARFCVASFGRGVTERRQEPKRAVTGLGDGVGMVKS